MIELTGKYTTATIFANTVEEAVYSQVYDIINCRAFEGQKVVLMPDAHSGKSGPCGLVATIGRYVCPEHIGVDIGCSVSLMVLDKKIPAEKYAEFDHRVKKLVPFGNDLQERTIIDERDFRRFLTAGFNKYRNQWPEMLFNLPDQVTEDWISEQLKRIGMAEAVFYKSLGTVGSGNHYVEYDEQDNGELAGVNLHFGSRNFGVKICNYWMRKATSPISNKEMKVATEDFKEKYTFLHHGNMEGFNEALIDFQEKLKERQINGYLHGEYLCGYLCDMCFAQLYAQYNHKTVQDLISSILKKYGIKVVKIITSVHNYIDLQDHTIRKSAIRSYAGEEMLVPFNMKDGIAICEGKSNESWLNSCAHGAGRRMSRSAAKRELSLDEFKKTMEGVYSTTICPGTIDESPMAYKDTREIIDLIQETCTIKAILKPRINIKATKGEGE